MYHLYFFFFKRIYLKSISKTATRVIRACGGTGRRDRLKIYWGQLRGGSIPFTPTK